MSESRWELPDPGDLVWGKVPKSPGERRYGGVLAVKADEKTVRVQIRWESGRIGWVKFDFFVQRNYGIERRAVGRPS